MAVAEGMYGLPDPESLVVGLNPPFGKNGSLANKFVEHAARFLQPRMIVLIVPPATVVRVALFKVWAWTHAGKNIACASYFPAWSHEECLLQVMLLLGLCGRFASHVGCFAAHQSSAAAWLMQEVSV